MKRRGLSVCSGYPIPTKDNLSDCKYSKKILYSKLSAEKFVWK